MGSRIKYKSLVLQVRCDGFEYIAMGNSTNKKDAQTNAAKDFVQFLVRKGLVEQSEVPAMEMVRLISTNTNWKVLWSVERGFYQSNFGADYRLHFQWNIDLFFAKKCEEFPNV